ncbi:MAG: sel1 repeat family protein, partial [Planctomycetaceae bacterium]|nr:sel1 repeat family protein [Planctomycetaceae bacterium]
MTKTFQQTFFTILCISVVLTACSCTYAQTDDLKKQILNEFKDFKDYVKNNEYNHEGYIEKKQNDKLSIWEKAVEAGIAEGQFLYGICCIDTEKYDEDGIKWIRKAAEQGNDEAQLLIANTYSSNAGHEKEAVKWYRKAAEQGNAMAQLILGGYYAEGIGVDKNLEEAV